MPKPYPIEFRQDVVRVARHRSRVTNGDLIKGSLPSKTPNPPR